MIGRGGFPAEEMAARLAGVRAAMVSCGLGACVVMAPESQLWLSGLESFISGLLPQALIVPAAADRQMMLVVWDADIPLARATAIVEEVHGYRFGVDDPIRAVRARLAASPPGVQEV